MSGYEIAGRDVQSKVKTGATSRQDTVTPTNDPHLAGFVYGEDVHYRFDGVLRVFASVANIDFRWQFAASAGVTLLHVYTHASEENVGFAADLSRSDRFSSIRVLPMNAFVNYNMHMHGMFKANADGILDFQWAQGTLNGNSMTLHAGSYIDLMRVGSS